MVLHNTMEDLVIPKVNAIFNSMEKDGSNHCTCSQCRMDTACYVLNRVAPYYLVSNRGAARIQQETIERQQKDTDITVLIYEGLKRINHNQRPNFEHKPVQDNGEINTGKPVYNIPSITGRLLNGGDFAPVSGVFIELLFNGVKVTMKDGNWQNPLNLVTNTEGIFSFWPVPVPAEKIGETSSFEYSIHVESDEYETLNHIFNIPVTSEIQTTQSFSLVRTFKLPDLYLFPPGEEQDRYILV